MFAQESLVLAIAHNQERFVMNDKNVTLVSCYFKHLHGVKNFVMMVNNFLRMIINNKYRDKFYTG